MSYADIKCCPINRFEDLRDYSKPEWVYRGVERSIWDLKTSFELLVERLSVPKEKRFDLESELLREFRRAYQNYAVHLPADNATLEWYSIMRHYGAPTRLLDFSYSIYVAAYFALEKSECDSAIWAIHDRWALKQTKKAFGKQADTIDQPNSQEVEKTVSRLFFGARRRRMRAACPVNPFRLNDRLRSQRGLFFLPADPELSFMDHFKAMVGYDDSQNVVKLILPREHRWSFLHDLWNMNITRTSLFPGLDGFAATLGVYHVSFADASSIIGGRK